MAEYVRHLRDIVGGEELLQIPSVSIALRDGDQRVLVARHCEGGLWLLPGGAIEPGESPADAAVREMWEETGLLVRLTGLVGVFGGPDFIVEYRNGHRTSYVMSVFEATPSTGGLRLDCAELLEARFITEPESRTVQMARWVPEVLRAVFEGHGARAFRQPSWVPQSPE